MSEQELKTCRQCGRMNLYCRCDRTKIVVCEKCGGPLSLFDADNDWCLIRQNITAGTISGNRNETAFNARIAELEKALEDVLHPDTAFPLDSVLETLRGAAESLLNRYGYDGHGWEIIYYSMEHAVIIGEKIKLARKRSTQERKKTNEY